MTSRSPLPPHLARFVREQIAAGRFQSEGEVIRAALRLLEAASPIDRLPGRRPTDSTGPGERTALSEKWESPGEWLAASANDHPLSPARRSPRGILADLRRGITFDDIKSARQEMWSGLRHGGA